MSSLASKDNDRSPHSRRVLSAPVKSWTALVAAAEHGKAHVAEEHKEHLQEAIDYVKSNMPVPKPVAEKTETKAGEGAKTDEKTADAPKTDEKPKNEGQHPHGHAGAAK